MFLCSTQPRAAGEKKGSLLLQGLGRASGWPWRGPWSSAGHSLQPPDSPASPRTAGLEGPGEKVTVTFYCTLCPEDHVEADHRPSGTPNRNANGHELTVTWANGRCEY